MENNKLIEMVKSSLKTAKYDLKESLNSIEVSAKNLIDDKNIGYFSKKVFHENINVHSNKVAYLKGKIDAYEEILNGKEND